MSRSEALVQRQAGQLNAKRLLDVLLGVIKFIARKLASMKRQDPERFPVPATRGRNQNNNRETQCKVPPDDRIPYELVIFLVSFACRQRMKPRDTG